MPYIYSRVDSRAKEMNVHRTRFKLFGLLPLFAALHGFLAPSAHAAPSFEDCPRQIVERPVSIEGGPKGWSAYLSRPLRLQAAGFTGGAPATKTDLKPDSSVKHGRGEIDTWKFDPGFLSEPDGLWLACAYGEGHELTLSKKISIQFVECTVAYADLRTGVDRNVHVTCK